MSVYLYAICGEGSAVPSCEGLHGRPLRMVHAAGLSALVSPGIERASLGSESDLWEHERAVEALMREHDVLPARFGTLAPAESDISDMLRSRAREFTANLQQVAGMVEVGVRAVLRTPAEVGRSPRGQARSGTEYLQAAKLREQSAAELEQRLAEALDTVATASRVRRVQGLSHMLTGAYLVARERIDEFRSRVAELSAATDLAELVCTGPWPPYSFMTGNG